MGFGQGIRVWILVAIVKFSSFAPCTRAQSGEPQTVRYHATIDDVKYTYNSTAAAVDSARQTPAAGRKR